MSVTKISKAGLKDNSIDSDQYVDGSIDNAHLADDAVDSDEIASGAIDNDHMAANSVDSDQYVDGSIDNAHLAANSVDSDQYVDGSIDNVHLADDAVDSDELAAGAVDIAHLSATGTAGSGNYLRGDNSWASISTSGAYDLNGGELVLDADGDTSITADTDNTIDIRIAGADDFQITANTLSVLSGSTLNIDSGATIANSGTATGFGGSGAHDLNGGKLTLDADADTSIIADTDDQIDIEIAGANDFQMTANTFTALSGSTIATDTIAETTAAAGVTIDSVLLKDGGITTTAPNLAAIGSVAAPSYSFSSDPDTGFYLGPDPAGQVVLALGGEWVMYTQNGDSSPCAFQNTGASTPYMMNWSFPNASPDDNTRRWLKCEDSTAERLLIYSDGDIANHDGVYGTISDETLKQDLELSGSQWDDIKAIGRVTKKYRMKTDVDADTNAPTKLGWTAQDVEMISPGLVVDSPTGDDGTGPSVKWVKSSILYAKAIKALAEAMERIEVLEEKVG